jgi:hypothetical protein
VVGLQFSAPPRSRSSAFIGDFGCSGRSGAESLREKNSNSGTTKKELLEQLGIEPRTFRMQSERATTALQPPMMLIAPDFGP